MTSLAHLTTDFRTACHVGQTSLLPCCNSTLESVPKTRRSRLGWRMNKCPCTSGIPSFFPSLEHWQGAVAA